MFSNSRCYFLQQPVLQHFCLPLQQSFVCALTVEAPKNAARLTISRRYFIQFSCLSFPIILGYAVDRVPTDCSGDHRTRRRNGRSLRPRCKTSIAHRNRTDQSRLRYKSVSVTKIKEQAGCRRRATCRRTRGCSAGIDWTAEAGVHIHVRATSFLLDG